MAASLRRFRELELREDERDIQYFHECDSAAKANRTNTIQWKAGDPDTRRFMDDNATDLPEDIDPLPFTVTSEDMEHLMCTQTNERDMLHGHVAVEIATQHQIFPRDSSQWIVRTGPAHFAIPDDLHQLEIWKQQMKSDVNAQHIDHEKGGGERNGLPQVAPDVVMMTEENIGATFHASRPNNLDVVGAEQSLAGLDVSRLNAEQFQAFDIIRQHLDQTLAGKSPPPMRSITYGAGGTGKSQVIQTVTAYFDSRNVSRLLLKAAYTGIAASLIKGKTTHYIGQFSFRELDVLSNETRRKLEKIWSNAAYLIIDEFSMISKSFLCRLSRAVSIAVHGARPFSNHSFGGIDVMLFGDLHQFPPVGTKTSESLFYPINPADSDDAKLGRQIYEEFTTVVILRQQYRFQDEVWNGFLQRLRDGKVNDNDVIMLKELVISHPNCPIVDFSSPSWSNAALVTPRHGVCNTWNEAAAYKWCRSSGEQLFICDAEDSIKGRPLDNMERFILLSPKTDGTRQRRRRELPNRIHLARGLKVMVTTNIETDLDVTNGARGEIVDIILHPDEDVDEESPVVKLKYLPSYILVKLHRTRASALEGLGECIIPIEPAMVKMQIRMPTDDGNKTVTRTVTRRQYPMTSAYAFTDYQAQGQTIVYLIVDIAKPPYGRLSLFNVYVALSRGVGRNNIRLLRDFDEEILMQGQVKELVDEDKRLEDLDRDTRQTFRAQSSTT